MGYSVGQEGNKTGARQSGGLGELRAFFHIIFSTLPISETYIEGVSTLPISFASIELGASSVTVLWGVHLRYLDVHHFLAGSRGSPVRSLPRHYL